AVAAPVDLETRHPRSTGLELRPQNGVFEHSRLLKGSQAAILDARMDRMALPSVAIVVPNWNGAGHLPDCLDALRNLDYPPDLVSVVVVDNGSTDGSRAVVEDGYSEVRLVTLAANEGFAAACNAGARAVEADCLAFINNDMRVEPTWLRALVD